MLPACPRKLKQIDLTTLAQAKAMNNPALFQYTPTNGREAAPGSTSRHFGNPLNPLLVMIREQTDSARMTLDISTDDGFACVALKMSAKQLREAACALLDAAYTIENTPTAQEKSS